MERQTPFGWVGDGDDRRLDRRHTLDRHDVSDLEHPRVVTRSRPTTRLLVAAAVTIAIACLVGAFGLAPRDPNDRAVTQGASGDPASSPSQSPLATAHPGASFPSEVDGSIVHSVSDLLRLRADGTIAGERVALRGYWLAAPILHSCNAGPELGELEMGCHDTEYGITEVDEPARVLGPPGLYFFAPVGPHLTPFVSKDLSGPLFKQQYINGQPFPPVPIVVIGHFDDPRASKCRPSSVKICRDRLVVDRIVEFDPTAVPTPGVTPAPTPFPFDHPPAAKFAAEQCAGDVPYSFVGWKPLGELLPDWGQPEEVVFAAVTRDVVPLGEWGNEPRGSGPLHRPMGRLICFAFQWGDGSSGHVPGSAYQEWADGHRTPISP